MNKIRDKIIYLPREEGLEMLRNDGINRDIVYCVGGTKSEVIEELKLKGDEKILFWENMHQPDDFDDIFSKMRRFDCYTIYYDCRYLNGMAWIEGGNEEVIKELISELFKKKQYYEDFCFKLVILAYESDEDGE